MVADEVRQQDGFSMPMSRTRSARKCNAWRVTTAYLGAEQGHGAFGDRELLSLMIKPPQTFKG